MVTCIMNALRKEPSLSPAAVFALVKHIPLEIAQHSKYNSTARFPTRQNTSQLAKEIPRSSNPVCLLFNDQRGNRCTFNPCKFRHICSACNARHPFSVCTTNKRQHSYSHKGQLERKMQNLS